MMTPERRAEIDAMLIRNHDDEELADALHDAIVEIDRLNKAVDQAIYRLGPTALDMGVSDLEDVPELAAELERRSKA